MEGDGEDDAVGRCVPTGVGQRFLGYAQESAFDLDRKTIIITVETDLDNRGTGLRFGDSQQPQGRTESAIVELDGGHGPHEPPSGIDAGTAELLDVVDLGGRGGAIVVRQRSAGPPSGHD
ncbi:MAG TPA: hypothetical protein PLY51_10965, partial [Microthrixaceae bacterium]|nr:hypothetical protein [Microthrixaceae bacterium]